MSVQGAINRSMFKKPSKHKPQSYNWATNPSSNSSGAVLLTVVILIIIIGITGVAIYSFTTTSTFSQLSAQHSTQASYLAESGFRVIAEEYNYAAEDDKNSALENLHNATLTLSGMDAQFDFRIYPYWFYLNAPYTAGDATIQVKVPGGIPLRDPANQSSPTISIPNTGSLKLRGKTRLALITNSTVTGDIITFALDTTVTPPGFPYDISAGDEVFLLYEDASTPIQTISQKGSLVLSGSNPVAQILPAENGSFRIYNENNDKMDYTYRNRMPGVIDPTDPPATITLTGIDHQNPADPSVFPFQTNIATELFLGKNLAVYSTSTVGQGTMAGRKTVGNYTDVGIDAGFFTGKETISFDQDIQDFDAKMGLTGGGEILEGASDAPIVVDTTSKEIQLGKNLTGRYGSIWYKGDTDIANCIQGECDLGKGFRAYFEMQFDGADTDENSKAYGDGFTFSIMSAATNDDTDSGSGGEYLGYAGPGLNNGIQAPKIGLEIDTYPNPGGGDICGGNSRRDDTPVANHAALVYWGEDTPGSFDAQGGYLSLGSANWASTEGTISFWFKRDTIYYGNGFSTGDRLWGQNGNMEVRFSSDGQDLILDWGSTNSLTRYNHPFKTLGKWYFFVITWDENNKHLDMYWGDESTLPQSLASTPTWSSKVTTIGVLENLFLNSSGGDNGKNFRVEGKGIDLRYYNNALDKANLNEIYSIYNSRTSSTTPRDYFPLQSDVANAVLLGSEATAVGNTGWSEDAPSNYPTCDVAAFSTYDDNRHGSGGSTTPINSLNIYDSSGDDGYFQVTKGSDTHNWLEDGQPHQVRMELIRPLQPSVDGVVGGTNYEYQIKIWVDCPDCSEEELTRFQNVNASFTDWAPLIQKTIANGNQLVLDSTTQDQFKKTLFGFTQGTGEAMQNITLRDFELYFLKRYPADLASW